MGITRRRRWRFWICWRAKRKTQRLGRELEKSVSAAVSCGKTEPAKDKQLLESDRKASEKKKRVREEENKFDHGLVKGQRKSFVSDNQNLSAVL